MDETKKERTLDDIRVEYSKICSQAGHLQYQIATLKADLTLLNDQLKSLNLEATAVAAKTKQETPNE